MHHFYVMGSQKICVIPFIPIFTLSLWFETKPNLQYLHDMPVYKNTASLNCIPETNIISYINYISVFTNSQKR